MAKRIVFLPTGPEEANLFKEVLIDFKWIPGMAISQAQKSVANLHASIAEQISIENTLEVSTRSLSRLGLQLSAFNLQVIVEGKLTSVETGYQSSKLFQKGGPYLDLLEGTSILSKRDPRLKNSGEIVGFQFSQEIWPLRESPNFYDFLYIKGLLNTDLRNEARNYQAFTDIAFSQISLDYKKRKSYNCQARSVCIYISLLNRMPESEILPFLHSVGTTSQPSVSQLDLF